MNRSRPGKRTIVRIALFVALFAAVYAVRQWAPVGGRDDPGYDVSIAPGQVVSDAFLAGVSGVMVESSGTVVRMLSDDLEGSRHQRFIVEVARGHTVLISHNIDLAERVPVSGGDTVRFRGQYEWNERGGVVHWTHHDPAGRRPGGWIEAGGRRVR